VVGGLARVVVGMAMGGGGVGCVRAGGEEIRGYGFGLEAVSGLQFAVGRLGDVVLASCSPGPHGGAAWPSAGRRPSGGRGWEGCCVWREGGSVRCVCVCVCVWWCVCIVWGGGG
jgi:hypothetical protein